MIQLPIQNIANIKRDIYLFTRDSSSNRKIIKDSNFYPYYYEPCEDNTKTAISIDGKPVKRVYVPSPYDIKAQASRNSYESDVKFTNRYLNDVIDVIEPSTPRICFLDIEVQATNTKDKKEYGFPISSITVYDSYTKDYKNYFLGDYRSDKQLLYDFIDYIKTSEFDIITAWNVDFDYGYISNRCDSLKINFPRLISPISSVRGGKLRNTFYPNGISVVDMMVSLKKMYMREASYTLDYIGEKFLGVGKKHKSVDFSKLDETVRERNIDDVNLLVGIENKIKLFEYYDGIRRQAIVQWEDLLYSSRIVSSALLKEAKAQNIVLPNRPKYVEDSVDDEESKLKGATRQIEKLGLYKGASEHDLTSAYPCAIIDFCLDVSNLRKDASEDNVLNINGVYVKQNKNTLLPLAVKKILNLKDKYKKLIQQYPDDKKIATDYAAIKSIVNSFFGVFGSKYFNLYNLDIANSITFIIRDLMEYVSVALQNLGYEIIYIDTDGIIINVDHDISDIVNKLVKRWGKEKYAKDIEHLGFSYEHTYYKLFILGKCHLWGKYGDNKDKMRGIEAKRASSSKYEAKFQIALLEYILNEKDYTFCNNFLIQEISKFKSNSLIDISFPCKLPDRVYEKNYPIIQRAYDNAVKYIPGFKVNIGELFHYTYVSSESIDVIAFREEDVDYIVERFGINYDKLINRNITNKASAIFKAMNWNINLEKNQCALID